MADLILHPPRAQKIPHPVTVHGETWDDPYFWLRDKDNPAVMEYLRAENAYTDAMLDHLKPLCRKLYQEMVSRINETDVSVPEQIDDYFYYSRTEAGYQYPIYARKKDHLEADEEIILDVNQLAEGHTYCHVGQIGVSPDHRWMAYVLDTTGYEDYTLYIKNLQTGELLPDVISGVKTDLQWTNDNQALLYTVSDDAMRSCAVYQHVLGDDPAQDQQIYFEADECFSLYLQKTRSKKYFKLISQSALTSEVRILGADQVDQELMLVAPRRTGRRYELFHHEATFYILTNEDAKNYRLMKTPEDAPGREHWQDVIPHRQAVKLDDVMVFKRHLVLWEREKGLIRIRIISLVQGDDFYLDLPEPTYTVYPVGNSVYDKTTLRFAYTSLVTPRSIFEVDMDTGERTLLKQYEVRGGYDASQYRSERIYATARDGTEIPISLVYRVGMTLNGKNPLILYGYGSYGISSEPYFNSDLLSLLDRGVIWAIAHVRGGGELGEEWHENGRFLHKKNTFTDFIDCAEHLIAQNYTNPAQLAIMGGSAGGLLMGAVINLRPDLFRVVLAKVPFVDVVNTMLDASLPLTTGEYEEWGNPNDKVYFDYIRSYSPYDNVVAQDYPEMLVTTGLNDPRVHYWEPVKWVAKLRDLKTSDNLLFLKTNLNAGHGGASGRYERLKETAFDFSFLLDRLGITA
ncbi:MAG: S9 family peptidase [Gemmatimonadetes bacterium]|nr:MAG: S9 family peptidase [Gemmatimonadota bacterium]